MNYYIAGSWQIGPDDGWRHVDLPRVAIVPGAFKGEREIIVDGESSAVFSATLRDAKRLVEAIALSALDGRPNPAP